MMFSSYEEETKCVNAVKNREKFDDLNSYQMAAVQGMYWAIEALDNQKYEYDDGDTVIEKLQNGVAKEVVDECIERVEMDIINMVVSFRDQNAEDEV